MQSQCCSYLSELFSFYGKFVIKNNDRIIVALDLPTIREAEELVDKLGDAISFYKIGLALAPIGGFQLAKKLKSLGKRVFLDLKLYDINQTIENAVRNLQELNIDFLTIHGDPHIIRAAVKANKNGNIKIL